MSEPCLVKICFEIRSFLNEKSLTNILERCIMHVESDR